MNPRTRFVRLWYCGLVSALIVVAQGAEPQTSPRVGDILSPLSDLHSQAFCQSPGPLAGAAKSQPAGTLALPVVRTIYLIPSDRNFREDYAKAQDEAIRHLQNWYKEQMSGKTFVLNDPVIEVVKTDHISAWYSTNPVSNIDQRWWFFYNVVHDGGNPYLISPDLYLFFADAELGCNQLPGGSSRLAVLASGSLKGLMGEPRILPCSGQEVRGSVASAIGAVGHELGHAFGLNHPPGCPGASCPSNVLMAAGYGAYPDAFLLPEDKEILELSPFFVNQVLGPPQISAIVNGASFAEDEPVAPGSIVTIFGTDLAKGVDQASELPLPTSLLGTRVSVGDTNIPLYYVSPNQINAQMPFELQTSEGAVRVCVDDSCGDPKAVSIVPTSPGLFTWPDGETAVVQDLGPDGRRLFVLDPDNTNAFAAPGDFLVFYASGLGQTMPATETNTPGPATSPLPQLGEAPLIAIGGRNLPILFAGLTPGYVGLYQINVQLPQDVMLGNDVAVVVTSSDRVSNVATIPIRAVE